MTHTFQRENPTYTPHQAQFLEIFMAEAKSGSVHLLIASTGYGKSFVVSRSIGELFRSGRMKRILVVCPALLTLHFEYTFRDIGEDPIILDGRAQRLIREEIGSCYADFPIGIYIVSIDLAKREDIRAFLAEIPWDLVVVDEAQQLRGQKLTFFESLVERDIAPAVLMMMPNYLRGLISCVDRARIFDWNAETERKDPTGMMAPQVISRFHSNEIEIAIGKDIINLARAFEPVKGIAFIQAATSSMNSLEGLMVRSLDLESSIPELGQKIEAILGRLENLTRDSRLECFTALIGHSIFAGGCYMTVFCEYRNTLDYLAASLDESEFSVHQLHGGLSSEQRIEVLHGFRTKGGILIATTAALQGMSLEFVDVVVHYDLPISGVGFTVRESFYNRYGRSKPCVVYLLKDENKAFRLDAVLLERFQASEISDRVSDPSLKVLFQALVNDA